MFEEVLFVVGDGDWFFDNFLVDQFRRVLYIVNENFVRCIVLDMYYVLRMFVLKGEVEYMQDNSVVQIFSVVDKFVFFFVIILVNNSNCFYFCYFIIVLICLDFQYYGLNFIYRKYMEQKL